MAFTQATQRTFESAVEVIDSLKQYWPLTLRQIYYQLVAALAIPNNLDQYKRLSRILSQARIDGLLTWDCMEDRSRSFLTSGGWFDQHSFVQDELDGFLVGYRRDLLLSQDSRLEVWVEKDALASIVHKAAFPYCVSVIVAKGFSSTTYVNQCRERIESDTRPTRVLYFGDFDPSGWEMPEAMFRKLTDEMGVDHDMLDIQRCALLPEQIQEHGLPEDPEAMKPGDSRTAKFKRLFGADVSPVELDALRPDILQAIVTDSIQDSIDVNEYQRQLAIQDDERQHIAEISGQVQEFLSGMGL